MIDWLKRNVKGSGQSEAAEVKSFVSRHAWKHIDSLQQHFEDAEQAKYTKEQRREIVTKAIESGKQEDLMPAAALSGKHSTLLKDAVKAAGVDYNNKKVKTIVELARDMKFAAKHGEALQTARDNYRPEISAPEHNPENDEKAQQHITAAREYQEDLKRHRRGMSPFNRPLQAVATTPSLDSAKSGVGGTQDDILAQSHFGNGATSETRVVLARPAHKLRHD